MAEVQLAEELRHPQQRVSLVRLEGDIASLVGPSLEIRFPVRWARKLTPWYRGTGRTILCNADRSRFNLVGVTKVSDHLILSYVESAGELAAERVAGDFIEALEGLLRASA
ncbi:MAG: hypothetical protein ACE5KQ_00175 [Thermoplasmata archaeon]